MERVIGESFHRRNRRGSDCADDRNRWACLVGKLMPVGWAGWDGSSDNLGVRIGSGGLKIRERRDERDGKNLEMDRRVDDEIGQEIWWMDGLVLRMTASLAQWFFLRLALRCLSDSLRVCASECFLTCDGTFRMSQPRFLCLRGFVLLA